MRLLARVLSVLLLLAPTARTAAADSDIILDDDAPSVQLTGTWATSTTTSGYFGSGYHYRVAGDGSSTVTWRFNAPAAQYDVFARWTGGPNRASNATYVITHAAGTAPVTVDQRANSGGWQSLGSYLFSSGADQGVRLSDKADGIVVADAIRWLPTGAATTQAQTPTLAQPDQRFFDETRFRIDNAAFWDFFQKRGGVRTFGFPVSREFTFFGCQTQLFQRFAMQQCGDAGVGTLNVLDGGLLPYNHFHGSTVPMPDSGLIASAPLPGDPDYASKAIEFVRANAPDTVNGEPVNFLSTFNTTVSLTDAFPSGGGDKSLLPLLNLQL